MKNDLKNQIINLRKKGLSYKKIRTELNCSIGIIYYHCRNAGLNDFNKLQMPTKKEIDNFQLLYDKYKSSIKVAQISGWSKATVLKYLKNKRTKLTDVERKKRNSQSVIEWRRRTKIKLIKYKGGKCEICGYNKCIDALEFHHKDPKQKDFNISKMGYGRKFEILLKEVDKCNLLCSNCHREIHCKKH